MLRPNKVQWLLPLNKDFTQRRKMSNKERFSANCHNLIQKMLKLTLILKLEMKEMKKHLEESYLSFLQNKFQKLQKTSEQFAQEKKEMISTIKAIFSIE